MIKIGDKVRCNYTLEKKYTSNKLQWITVLSTPIIGYYVGSRFRKNCYLDSLDPGLFGKGIVATVTSTTRCALIAISEFKRHIVVPYDKLEVIDG